ncbi:MAG: HIT domain-containing protein [Planctomycetota bacterium]
MTHEQIWAPWRLAYIEGDNAGAKPDRPELELPPDADPDCFLCQAAADSDDRGRFVVQRGEHSLVILNRYPYNNGHLLIAPCAHRARLDQLTAAVEIELIQEIRQMVGLLERVFRPAGFNVGLNLGRAAGAGLPGHLHWHVVPRWQGDTNFMPAVASTRVIPQSLEALWEALTAELAGK